MKRKRKQKSTPGRELDPVDGMPTRKALANELLYFRMRQLSETFYSAGWVEDLEFEVWDMAHQEPHQIAGNAVSSDMAKYFRDLAALGGGWWVWPGTAGEEGRHPISIPLSHWQAILAKRKKVAPGGG
jgi:hypothetical protein